MKLKISELNPNPFKKEINAGELDEETINKIMSNLDELGLMGALPVVLIDKKYYLVYGHHRLEALKRKFGKDYQVNVEVHNYNPDNLLRGMVVENLTQRSNEFHQEADNLLAIRKHLQTPCTLSGHGQGRKGNGTFDKCAGSVRDIANWLDKNTGAVMKQTKIADTLKIVDNLDEELLENIKKQSHATGEKDEDDETIGVKVATALASFDDKKEQKDLAKAIKQSREQHGNKKIKNITTYKTAPDEIKHKVRQLQLDIADVQDEMDKQELKQKADERPKTIFIPNLSERMKQLNKDINRLETQIEILGKIFHSSDFKERYNILKPKLKTKFNEVIFNIRERIETCYNEINFFEKVLNKNILEEKK